MGKGLAFSGRVGQCASTHSFHAVEHGELLFFLIQKKPAFVPDSEAFNSFIEDGFRVPELKGGSEASDGDQADNVNNEALYVIGLHGSGDKISLSACGIGRWQKVAPSCHMAVDVLCQEMYEQEWRRCWFGF